MKKAIKETVRIYITAIILMVFAFVLLFCAAILQGCKAQNVIRKGDVFVQVSDSNATKIKGSYSMTKFIYQTSDGTKYPIYMSEKGKCFIFRTSKKTGKQYRQYLPNITKQLEGKK